MLAKLKLYGALSVAFIAMICIAVGKIKKSARQEMKNKSMKQTLKAIKEREKDAKDTAAKSRTIIVDELRKHGWVRPH